MEVDGFNALDLVHDLHWVGANKEMLVCLEAIHGVTRTVAGDALVGLNSHKGRGEFATWVWIPGCVERWVQRQAHPG